ncbi:MAG: family 78 glycoside hydrolase catalytic domain [Candidatus Hinthialibacter antarcticus]|nr:family 78 glycoside hydrolase catalytic domain [Candidatus Hinthialibacter antarcticus]
MNNADPKSVFLQYIFAVIFIITITCSTSLAAASAKKPNIIFILTDDQRWDALGYAGNAIIQTPEMDKLARQGTFFKHTIVTTPICCASRASLFTGLYERCHRYTFQTGPIQDEYMQTSYPKLLRDSGYHTGFFGKFGVNYNDDANLFDVYESYDRNGRYPDQRGYFYKKLDGEVVHLTRYTGEKALDFIDESPADQPFCLSLSFSAPHAHDNADDQYFWQKETNHLYQDMTMPGPNLAGDEYFNELPLMVREGFNRTRWRWRYDTPEKYQHSVKGYYRMIGGIDLEIAKLRKKLEEKGVDDNTVIIVMGDNGYFLGERQMAGKWLMYDNSIRVPLIIFDPRVDKHQDIEAMALNVDIPSTILEYAGAKSPESYQGKSLVPIVAGQKSSLQRDAVLVEHLWEFENIPPSEGVRTAQWKYFRYVNDKSIEALYNLVDDPQETKNLARDSQYHDTLVALRNQCEELIEQHKGADAGVPEGMTVEFIREPDQAAIADSLPEYSWIVPKQAVLQKAYQILVSSSLEKSNHNIGDVWNSAQARSSQSINVEHAGGPLQPETTYYWKVRIWDKDNRLTDYSEVQTFKTGTFGKTVSTKNRFQIEHIPPTEFKKTSDGGYFVDFGKDAFGTLELNYKANKPETLIIRLGEKLKDGKIDQKPGGTIRYQEVELQVAPEQNHYVLQLPPDKRNTNQIAVALPESLGVVTPFRYCEIENAKQGLSVDDVRQKALFHYFKNDESSFTSSDSTLDQIWELCKYSMKATSFAGLYVDGDRERIPYEGDAYINLLSHYCVDREYAISKQTIEYFMDHSTWPTEWLLHTAMLVYQDYYYTGDTELLTAYYERLKEKSLMDLAREDGLISSELEKVTDAYMKKLGFPEGSRPLEDLVDWPPGERDGYDRVPINTVVNCFFYQNMVIMAEFAAVLDKPEEADHFNAMAAKVKQAINTKLFDATRGVYVDGEGSTHASLHANMMPLAFGITPEKYVAPVAAFVKSRGMACSVYGAQYLMEGLYNAGEEKYALDLMRAKHDRSWWNMIKVGSTITMEAWDMKYKPNSDWNHAWGAVPGNIIPRFLWGIQPKTPGFKITSIHPQMGDLANSSIVFPTVRGQIKGEYQRVNNRLQKYRIELPANMAAEFALSTSPEDVITLNGETVNLSFGNVRLYPGVNQIEIRINSF